MATADARKTRILHVDDDEATRYAVGKILSRAGFEVLVAADGAEALERVKEQPDLVLLDVNLPDMSGFEVCRGIKSDPDTASIPVIHLSSTHVHSTDRVHGLEGGADGYLTHPIDARELEASVRAFLRLRVAERRNERLAHLYAMLYHTNETLLRARSEEQLFHGICHVVVEHGELVGATIRIADPETKLLRREECSESMQGLPALIPGFTHPAQTGRQRATTIAFAENRVVVENYGVGGSAAPAWEEDIRARGVRSAVALPLRREGRPIGTLTLSASLPDYFDAEMVRLIEQMGEDISFALEGLESARRREEAERAVKESEQRYRALVEQSIAGIYVVQDGLFAYVNPRLAEIAGYEPAELIGQPFDRLVSEEDREMVAENVRMRMAGEVRSLQYQFRGRRKDGSTITVGVHGARTLIGGRPAIIGLAQDISERERAQQQIRSYMEQLEQAMLSTVNAVSAIAQTRDPYTAGHEKRVGALARRIGEELGLPPDACRGLEIMGGVHDIGKVSVPAEILAKPGRLSAMEFELIKSHSQTGYDVLKDVSFPWPVAQAILQHHERLDGSGYPQGLKGEEIILEARILAVADVVEAMGSHRPYRPTLGIDVALAEIEKFRGERYDEKVVDACLRLFREKGYSLPSS